MARYGSYAGGGSYLDAVQDEMGYGTTGTGRPSYGGYGAYLDGSYGRGFAEDRRAQDAGGSRISIKDAFDLVKSAADIKNRRDRLEFDREQHAENVRSNKEREAFNRENLGLSRAVHEENVRSAKAREDHNTKELAERTRASQASEKHNKDSLALNQSILEETKRSNKAKEEHDAATRKRLEGAQDFEIEERKEAAKRQEDDDFLQASRALSEKNPSYTSWLDNDITLSDEEEALIEDRDAKAKAGRMATFIKVLSGGKLTESDLDRANEAFGFDGVDEWFDKIEVDKDGNAVLMAYMKDKKTGKQVRVAYPFTEESYADVVDSAIALYQTRPDLTRKVLNSLPEDIRRDAIGNIRARGAERRANLEYKQNLERDQISRNQAYAINKGKEIDAYIEDLQAQKSAATSDEDEDKIDGEIKRLRQMKRELFGLTAAGQPQTSANGGGTGDAPSTSKTTVLNQPVATTNGLGSFNVPR